MMSVLGKILIVLAACIFMECVAWFTHKYIMHGPLWKLHQDHHKKLSAGFFERNDFFFLIFAVPGIAALLVGIRNHFNFIFWVGTGITLYGVLYFFVHDILIHQRFKLFRNTNNAYLLAIRRAHKMHHKHLSKNHGESFGMLLVPFKYFRKNQLKMAE